MAFNQFTRNLESVTDPTDWQKSLFPALGALDGLLRCFVCKEFFRAPVITACNHSFCSQCIREALVTSGQCPLCGCEQYESSLRRDPHLEEVAGCFSGLRPALLDLLQPASVPDVIEIASDEEEPSKTVNNGSKAKSRTPLTISSDQMVTDDSQVDQNIPEIVPNIASSSSKPYEDSSSSISSLMVLCPVCDRQMSAQKLQTTHLDSCLTNQVLPPTKKRKSSISSFFLSLSNASSNMTKTIPMAKQLPQESYYERELKKAKTVITPPETKKLSKLDFASLSTPKVKEKLAHIGLPTTGTRAMLELRYNHYYILHNSNLDGNHPVSDKVLRQRLNRWELTNLAFSGSIGGDSSLFQTASSLSSRNISEKDFPIKLWNKQNDAEYRRLTRLARASANRDKNTVTSTNHSVNESPSAAATSTSN